MDKPEIKKTEITKAMHLLEHIDTTNYQKKRKKIQPRASKQGI